MLHTFELDEPKVVHLQHGNLGAADLKMRKKHVRDRTSSSQSGVSFLSCVFLCLFQTRFLMFPLMMFVNPRVTLGTSVTMSTFLSHT